MKYQLTEEVLIEVSGEKGRIVGRGDYELSQPQYLIRYCAGDGRAVEQWWNESALRLI
jgi:hypothetical protein